MPGIKETHRRYLGDGVYVDLEDGQFVLRTREGPGNRGNVIYLDFPVYVALERYAAEKMREAGEGREPKEGM